MILQKEERMKRNYKEKLEILHEQVKQDYREKLKLLYEQVQQELQRLNVR